VGNSVKGLTKVQVDDVHNLSLIHLVTEGDQVGQAGPAFAEPTLAELSEHTQDELHHNLAQHRGQADRRVVPRILLLALLVDGCYTGDPIHASKVTGTENKESFIGSAENFAFEGHRHSPCSFGASVGSETQVCLSTPVWRSRTFLDCSDNEQQDSESPITCLAQQEPGLTELLS